MTSRFPDVVDRGTIEGSGWQLRQAEGINDEGWIVGNGYLGGLWRGFVLVPYTIAEE